MDRRSLVTRNFGEIGAKNLAYGVTLRAPQTGWKCMSDDDLEEELEIEEPELDDDSDAFGEVGGPEIDGELDGEFELDEDDLDPAVLDDDLEVDIDDDLALGDEIDDVDDVLEATEAPAMPEAPQAAEEDDDDEIADPDDVEASLDDILKDRLVIEDDTPDDDDDETPDLDDRGEGASVVIPRRPDEFVCQSCFLVKHVSQIASAEKQLCRDCV